MSVGKVRVLIDHYEQTLTLLRWCVSHAHVVGFLVYRHRQTGTGSNPWGGTLGRTCQLNLLIVIGEYPTDSLATSRLTDTEFNTRSRASALAYPKVFNRC